MVWIFYYFYFFPRTIYVLKIPATHFIFSKTFTELYEKLQSPELSQLRQRIAVYFHLRPLDKDDIKNYIYHRLAIGMRNPGGVQSVIFTDKAIESIYHYTHGSPRTINMLCDRALLAGFVAETNSIDEHIIEKCVREMYSEHYS